jgi:hypothetical protein
MARVAGETAMVRDLTDGCDNLDHLYQPIGGKMTSMFRDHAEVVLSIVSAALMIAYSHGVTSKEIEVIREKVVENAHRDDNLSTNITRLERDGTGLSHANKWLLEQHAKEIIELKTDSRKVSEDLTDIKTEVRLISSWVKQQDGGRSALNLKANEED